ncbi:DUF3849 domain-containing protein [Enterocloster bolteae]|uniref:DUF3849 domain-containing protein n=1 Tax=Enterocloster bolteae TaxID=208479 RepID=UPI003AB643F8
MAGKREEQLKEITERLEQGVKDLFTSEKYTEYLKTMSQFHNYSFNNTLLIAMQKPESTLVAGYGTWSKKFHRQVKRGEKGIKIIAPVPIREKEEVEKFDPETNEPVLRPDGQPETEEVEHVIPRFRVATVFDISQTYGDPLPELDTPELMGSVENFEIFMEAIRMVSPAPMRYAEIEGESKGYYSNTNKEIVIKEDMSEKQTMKTAVHEVTHAMCHDRDLMEKLGEKKNKMTIETEAESVAFTVCSFFNLDVSDYSFPYLAGWASSMEMKELRSSMDFIRKTAGSFIDSMVENIQKLQKEKEAERELTEDDLVFQFAPLGEDSKKFYLVDNVGRVDLLRLLHTFAEQEGENKNPEQFLKSRGVHLDLWRDSEDTEKNQEMPEFYDVLYMDAGHIVDAAEFSLLVQVEMMISRAEYGHTALGREAHNLAVLYAYKLDNPRDTRELVNKLSEAVENPEEHNIREIMEDAQAEIDFLPDNQIGLMQMHEFGYRNDSVLPLKAERAVALHNAGLNIYSLNKDGSRTLMNTQEDILKMGTDGIFGIESREWESYQVMESVREENAEQEHLNEDLLFSSNQDRYAIYQIRDDGEGRRYLFMGTDYLKKQGFSVEYDDYRIVYSDVLGENETLDSLYEKFNIGRPLDFTGHSLSVSDVVVLKKGGEITAHYVDSFGYTELPEFFYQREKAIEKEKEPQESSLQEPQNSDMSKPYEKVYPPLYMHTITYAMEHGRADDYLESRKRNLDCKNAIEDAIRKNFDGLHLTHDAAKGIIEEYGAERVVFILANTVQHLEHDGRFSIGNKAWAKGYEIPENINRGMDMNADYVVSSHPAVLDGFIGFARDAIREQELGMEESVQIHEKTKGFIANGHFGTWYTVEAKEISGELFYRMEHEEYGDSVASIIVNQNGELVAEDLEHGFDQGAMEAISEYFSEKGIEMKAEPETPFIAQYYVIQNADGSKAERAYQYFSDMDTAVTAYHEIPTHVDKRLGMESSEQPPSRMSLIECRNGIETITDIEKYSLSGKWVREETMSASQKAKEYLDNCDVEIAYQTGKGYFSIQTVSDGYDYTIYGRDFREIDGGVYDNPDISIGEAMEAILSDEGIFMTACKVMDYEELQEKAEATAQEDLKKAQAKETEKGKLPLVSDMTEPEPALNSQSRTGIEETVLCYAQAQIDEMGLSEEVELLGARVYGSRTREGLYHEGSDIDVVVSYSGNLKEDAFFSALHEDGLKIAGIPVDINPISTEKTGTLEEYLENAEKYLDEKQSYMEIPESNGRADRKQSITFYVAECSEFHILGEFHERLETLQEAMELYEKIPAERINGIKSIGFCLADDSIYDGTTYDLMVASEIQTEFINEIPHYRESPLVQKAIADMEAMLLEQRTGQEVSAPEEKAALPQQTMPEVKEGKAVQMEENRNPVTEVRKSVGDTEVSEKQLAELKKAAENAPKTDRAISGGSKKQSVLNALRERQARMKAQEKEKPGQEKQGQKAQAKKKGEPEL